MLTAGRNSRNPVKFRKVKEHFTGDLQGIKKKRMEDELADLGR